MLEKFIAFILLIGYVSNQQLSLSTSSVSSLNINELLGDKRVLVDIEFSNGTSRFVLFGSFTSQAEDVVMTFIVTAPKDHQLKTTFNSRYHSCTEGSSSRRWPDGWTLKIIDTSQLKYLLELPSDQYASSSATCLVPGTQSQSSGVETYFRYKNPTQIPSTNIVASNFSLTFTITTALMLRPQVDCDPVASRISGSCFEDKKSSGPGLGMNIVYIVSCFVGLLFIGILLIVVRSLWRHYKRSRRRIARVGQAGGDEDDITDDLNNLQSQQVQEQIQRILSRPVVVRNEKNSNDDPSGSIQQRRASRVSIISSSGITGSGKLFGETNENIEMADAYAANSIVEDNGVEMEETNLDEKESSEKPETSAHSQRTNHRSARRTQSGMLKGSAKHQSIQRIPSTDPLKPAYPVGTRPRMEHPCSL